MGRVTLGLNASNDLSILSDVKATLSTSMRGIEVVSPDGRNITRGDTSNGSIKVDCIFCNNGGVRFDDARAIYDLGQNYVGANARQMKVDAATRYDFFSSLWVLTGGSGKNKTTAWSLCAIMPKNADQKASSDPGNIPTYGEFSAGVQYPKPGAGTDGTYPNCESTVPAMALAHYLYNDVSRGVDPVGVYSPANIEVEFQINSLAMGQVYQPVLEYGITLNGVEETLYVYEIEEKLEEGSYTARGYTR